MVGKILAQIIRSITFCLLLSSLISCHSSKRLSNAAAQPSSLEDQVHQLVNCLNTLDQACLMELYAEEFEGMAPLVNMEDKAAFVQQVVANYEKNQYHLKVELFDVQTSAQMGYAAMHWRLYEKTQLEKPIYQNRALSIWRWGAKGAWQMERLLFYRTDVQ